MEPILLLVYETNIYFDPYDFVSTIFCLRYVRQLVQNCRFLWSRQICSGNDTHFVFSSIVCYPLYVLKCTYCQNYVINNEVDS